MTNLPIAPGTDLDLIRDSLEQALAVSFPKSRSAAHAAAVNIAQQANKYALVNIEGQDFHYAVFGRDADQVAKALALSRYLRGLKAVQFFARGTLIVSTFKVEEVLACYLQATTCTDQSAHCLQVVPDPFPAAMFSLELNDGRTSNYLFPCAYLARWQPRLFREHPASPEDQIQAMAVKHGCDWCPNFKPENFKKI